MSKTSVVKARMEPELKAKGEAILKSLGLSTSTADLRPNFVPVSRRVL